MACSKQKRISYIGHSQGTTIGFAAFSQNQTLAAKVDLFIALAPVATVGNMKSPIKYLSYFSGGIKVNYLSNQEPRNYNEMYKAIIKRGRISINIDVHLLSRETEFEHCCF